ncbi:MAG: sigma factor-like helix-turn-helix DNA-binding protein [Patescibacteria group bacterium]
MQVQNSEENLNNDEQSGSILDAVIESEQAHQLAAFSPDELVLKILGQLRDRERQIVLYRYGLADNKRHTLEAIGKKLNITRERVRQIEKESFNSLKKEEISRQMSAPLDIVRKTIGDHGGIFAQAALVDHLLLSNKNDRQVNSLLFLLELSEHFHFFEENDIFHAAWHLADFDMDKLQGFYRDSRQIFEKSGAPLDLAKLKDEFKATPIFAENREYFEDRVIENLLKVIKHFKSNPFGEYGLHDWRVINPKDVGDKSYLILRYQNKPLHYTKITELINQYRFDARTAYKETVHNELIMDDRFVLVGRGIYALTDWGYKKGLVADVIKEILAKNAEPMERDKIIDEVSKQRIVRRNTILVGLANKKLFRKVGNNKYTLV